MLREPAFHAPVEALSAVSSCPGEGTSYGEIETPTIRVSGACLRSESFQLVWHRTSSFFPLTFALSFSLSSFAALSLLTIAIIRCIVEGLDIVNPLI